MLWSQHDVTFEHHQRYSARQLERVVEAAGLVCERTTYVHSLVFPIAAMWRILSYRMGLGRFAPKHDFRLLPAPLNAAIAGLYRLEAWLLQWVDLPFRMSAVCIARRPTSRAAQPALDRKAEEALGWQGR